MNEENNKKKILVVNGPNLNLLGLREPGIYGSSSLGEGMRALEERFPQAEFTFFQSNIEGELVDVIQQYGFTSDGIVLNAGAYTHTSVAIHDAIKAIRTPSWRYTSATSIAARPSATLPSSPLPVWALSEASAWTATASPSNTY